MFLVERNFVLANGEPAELLFRYNDRIVLLYNNMRLDRPADVIGKLIFPASTANDVKVDNCSELVNEFINQKAPSFMRRKVIRSGDTVCIKFVESDKKAVYTLTKDKKLVTVKDEYPVEGVLSEESAMGSVLIGLGTNDVVTFYEDDKEITIQVLSFFLKKTGIYQKMKEQKSTAKTTVQQKKDAKPSEEPRVEVVRARTIKTGDTVCVEFLDTKEKKAFKIVPAIVEVRGEFAAKPYRPTSYDSKTITDANPDEDTISETSPLGISLIGKKRGDITSYKVGSTKTEVRIIAFFDNDIWLKNRKNASR